jgi:hypothetical protein
LGPITWLTASLANKSNFYHNHFNIFSCFFNSLIHFHQFGSANSQILSPFERGFPREGKEKTAKTTMNPRLHKTLTETLQNAEERWLPNRTSELDGVSLAKRDGDRQLR